MHSAQCTRTCILWGTWEDLLEDHLLLKSNQQLGERGQHLWRSGNKLEAQFVNSWLGSLSMNAEPSDHLDTLLSLLLFHMKRIYYTCGLFMCSPALIWNILKNKSEVNYEMIINATRIVKNHLASWFQEALFFSLFKWKFAFHNISPPKLLHGALDLPVLKPVRQWPPEPRGPGQLSFENIPLIGPKKKNFCTQGWWSGGHCYTSYSIARFHAQKL